MRYLAILLMVVLSARMATAQSPDLGIQAPSELVESGLMKHLLPRFSLKTSIRIALSEDGGLKIDTASPGTPVFARGDRTYYLSHDGSAPAERFADWLTSDIGRRTIESFKPGGTALYTASIDSGPAESVIIVSGDAIRGEALSHRLCGRCHVISEKNRLNGLGSTPSFAALRTLPDWDIRFESFFTRNPHGAFTQVDAVTEAFDPARPSPISALEITLEDLEAIIAYAAALKPADLGAPIQHQ